MKATYQTIQGDTWDMIAKKVYGAEKHMDYLMENNFPLLDYFIFPAGITAVSYTHLCSRTGDNYESGGIKNVQTAFNESF